MLKLELFSRTNDEWDQVVTRSPRGLLFHMSDWLTAVEAAQGLKLVRLGIFRGKELIGVFPYFVKRYGPLAVIGSPLVIEDTHYMGPAVSDEDLPEVMRVFQEHVSQSWAMSYSRIVMPHDQPREHFEGYESVDNLTHVVDLTEDEDTLFARLKKSCRYEVRRASREGVTVEIADRPNLEAYWQLAVNLYTRQDRPPPSPRSFYEAVRDKFGGKQIFWALAKFEERLVAGAMLGAWERGAYYIDGVSASDAPIGSSRLLLWEAMRWAKAKGLEAYDFVGSNIPRFAQFKGSFGGDLLTYMTLERASPRWVRLLRQRYTAYKALVNRLRLLRP